jgi:hypothetical protein
MLATALQVRFHPEQEVAGGLQSCQAGARGGSVEQNNQERRAQRLTAKKSRANLPKKA